MNLFDHPVEVGTPGYWFMLGVLVLARGADFFSTWLASPGLRLEGNPLMRRLGWRGAVFVNVLVVSFIARWPLLSTVLATTSVLVSARNFKSAWLMRGLGEVGYLSLVVDTLTARGIGVFLVCLIGEVVAWGGVGLAITVFGAETPIVFSVGIGVICYALAIVVFSAGFVVSYLRRPGG